MYTLQVTLLGQGYGGVLVNLLLISPVTKGMLLKQLNLGFINWFKIAITQVATNKVCTKIHKYSLISTIII